MIIRFLYISKSTKMKKLHNSLYLINSWLINILKNLLTVTKQGCLYGIITYITSMKKRLKPLIKIIILWK